MDARAGVGSAKAVNTLPHSRSSRRVLTSLSSEMGFEIVSVATGAEPPKNCRTRVAVEGRPAGITTAAVQAGTLAWRTRVRLFLLIVDGAKARVWE